MIKSRTYTDIPGITEDYYKVRDFFIRRGYCQFTFARWDWMTTHSYLEKEAVGRIGLWEDGDKVVSVATFDCQLGETYLITESGYEYLYDEMIKYAEENLHCNVDYSLVIPDTDITAQDAAEKAGYAASPEKEYDAVFYTDKTPLEYALPEGFSITDMSKTYDMYQYSRVLWKGFNHELNGEGIFDEMEHDSQNLNGEMKRPNVNLKLKVAVVSPEGNFCAYCGIWYDENSGYGVIEPVATDPQYRKMGLGKAAVLEGIKRAAEMGAKKVVVGSSQQFYYSIGMRPYSTSTKWFKKLHIPSSCAIMILE